MANILKYSDYYNWQSIAKDFLFNIQSPQITESGENEDLSSMIKSVLGKFGFNMSLVFTFGTGVKFMYPIVSKLIENMQFEIKPSKEDIVLLCITSLSILYLEYKKEGPISADDIKNKLNPEIQMKFGNPRILINKLMKCFNSIFLFIKRFPKLFGVVVGNLIDIFSYTAILQPTMNAISMLIGTYNLTTDNLAGNLLSLATGIASLGIKNVVGYIKSKANKTSEFDSSPTEVGNLTDFDLKGNKLIKEQ